MCMVNLSSPEALQSHFDVAHPVADPPEQTQQQIHNHEPLQDHSNAGPLLYIY